MLNKRGGEAATLAQERLDKEKSEKKGSEREWTKQRERVRRKRKTEEECTLGK